MEYGYLAIWWVLTFSIVAGQTPKYALVRESIELNTGITTPPDEILWKHDGDKVVEFDGSQQQPYGSYGNRVTLNWHSADLKIEQLTFEDSGLYELEVFRNKELSRTSYKIEVIDRVPKPNITCEMNRDSSSDGSEHQASLTCSAEERQSQSLLTFEWSSNGNVQSGRTLTISLGNEHDKVVYTCTVSNPLTTESAEFTAEECYPDEGSSAALVAGIIVPIILLGLLILFFMLWKKGYCTKKKEDLKEQSASDKETGHEGKPLLGRAPTMPSNQPLHFPQKYHDHVELEDETEDGRDEPKQGHVKNSTKKFESPGPAGKSPAPDSDDSEDNFSNAPFPEGSVNQSSKTNTDKEGGASSPSPVTSEPDHKGKDEKAPGDDDQHEAEEKTATEGDPSHSDEADESESAELDTHISSRNGDQGEESEPPATNDSPSPPRLCSPSTTDELNISANNESDANPSSWLV